MALPAMAAPRATVVIVGGHEGGAGVPLTPLAEHGPLLRAASAGEELADVARQALDSSDQPVCVVPMTLGRDPRLIADSARTLMALTAGSDAGRVMLADPFGSPGLLTGWLRVAVNSAAGDLGTADLAVLLTAAAANAFDDAELFRIAHLVKVQDDIPWVEVAFQGGDPEPAEGIERCEQLGARRIAVIPADFTTTMTLTAAVAATDVPPDAPTGMPTEVPAPAPTAAPTAEIIDGGPLLRPSTIAGMLATRVTAAIHKLSRGDDGIATGLDAEHGYWHGGAS